MNEVNSNTEPVIEYRLNFEKNIEYYFTFLDPRFSIIDEFFKKSLEKRFKRKFEPINILSNKIRDNLISGNYIIVNSKLKNSMKKGEKTRKILLDDHGELNRDFSNSFFIENTINNHLQYQDQIFINVFITSFLTCNDERIIPVGPDLLIAKELDSKVNQRPFLRNLGVPIPSGKIYEDFCSVEEAFENGEICNRLLQTEYGAGGAGVHEVKNAVDLEIFGSSIRRENLNNRFIATEIIDFVLSPNSTAIVLDKDRVFVVSVSDQILKNQTYLGNIFPSKASKNVQRKLVECTQEIGLALARIGYRGFFGCDFLITASEEYYVVDLNPRKQGGLLCNSLMFERLKPKNFPTLIDLEMSATFHEELLIEDFEKFENPELNYIWAHSKINPGESNVKIAKEVCCASEKECFRNIGSVFYKSFFQKDSLFLGGNMLGEIIITGKNYESVLKKIGRLEKSLNFELVQKKPLDSPVLERGSY